MKLLLIGFTKLKYMPYMHFYLDRISTTEHEVHLIRWSRDASPDVEPPNGVTMHTFDRMLIDESGRGRKILPFIAYRKWAAGLLRKLSFDRVIVLHSLPGILVLRCLVDYYKGRYILDYRDQTYEQYAPFSKLIGRLVWNSFATFVSSVAYRSILPPFERVFPSHNLLQESLQFKCIGKRGNTEPIVISYWGLIRQPEINEQIIHGLGNDQRFILNYYGREQNTARRLKAIVASNEYENIFFEGEYLPSDRYKFARNTMMIHNMYDPKDPNIRMAVGNKYYDAIVFGLPQICTKGSYMAERVEAVGVGLAIDPSEANFADKLYDYYHAMDWPRFLNNCQAELDEIMTDLKSADEVIATFLGEEQSSEC